MDTGMLIKSTPFEWGEGKIFIVKINNGFYMKAKCFYYKCFLQDLKKLLIFVKSFAYKSMDWNFFIVDFLGSLKNH